MSPEPFPVLQGATDSEKRVQHLTLENEALKQSLTLTRDLLRHWAPGPPARAAQVFCFLAATSLQSGAPATLPRLPQDLVLAETEVGAQTVHGSRDGLCRSGPSGRLMPVGEPLPTPCGASE